MTKTKLRVFSGATAVITGAASGIGRALAEELARRRGDVVLADRQLAPAEKAAEAIRSLGGRAKAYKLDVTDSSAVEVLLKDTVKRTGRLDYMFNNAGIAIGGGAYLHSVDDWNKIIDVNLRGVVNGVQAAYRIMLAQGFGHIVNTASMAGLTPLPGGVSYATSKHAVVGLSKSLRAEAASEGIRVSVLCPGVIRTPILEGGGKYGKNLLNISSEQQRAMWERLRPMPPDAFARKALNAIASNTAIVIIPSWWKLFWFLDRLCPSLGILLSQKQYLNMIKMDAKN